MTSRIGFASALLMTALGVVCMAFIGLLSATGRFVMPPSESVQAFGGIITIVSAPIMVVLYVSTGLFALRFRRMSAHAVS